MQAVKNGVSPLKAWVKKLWKVKQISGHFFAATFYFAIFFHSGFKGNTIFYSFAVFAWILLIAGAHEPPRSMQMSTITIWIT